MKNIRIDGPPLTLRQRLAHDPIMNTRQKNAVRHVLQHYDISRREYEEKFSVTRAVAAREVAELVLAGWLRPSGRGSATRYVLDDQKFGTEHLHDEYHP
ncbi:MAG: hypothetical protein RRA94_12595 [Bacteroidota bacterium]|nr:hypothetical protein [Bacteroidota bacterium]